MKIIYFDQEKGVLNAKPETLEDLFHLYFIIDRGDRVKASTTRKITINKEQTRKPQVRIVKTVLTVEVEDLEYHEYMRSLRIKGKVVEDPQELGVKGSYHTLNLKLNREVTINKEKWYRHHLERIKRALEETKTEKIIVVALDSEEGNIAVLTSERVKHLATVHSRISHRKDASGKRKEEELRFFSEISKEVEKAIKNFKTDKLIIAGPGFVKERFSDYLSEKFKYVKKWILTSSTATMSAYNELIKSGAVENVIKKLRISEETKTIQELLLKIVKNPSRVTYGFKEVWRAAEMGAVDNLMISEEIFRTTDLEIREKLEELIKTVEEMRGKVKIISGGHEGSKHLKSLGGIAAFLRYPIEN